MVNEIAGAILQVLAFSLIPFIVHLVRTRSPKGFFAYIGLVRSNPKANILALFVSLLFAAPILVLTLTNQEFRTIMFDPKSVTGKFREMGFGVTSLSLVAVIALIKTSLSEEILFRGFLAKRLVGSLGFRKGNILQAVIFGAIHTMLFAFITTNAIFLAVIFLVRAAGAYISVYLNEEVAGGSILPGWISHALANVMSYSVVGFLL